MTSVREATDKELAHRLRHVQKVIKRTTETSLKAYVEKDLVQQEINRRFDKQACRQADRR